MDPASRNLDVAAGTAPRVGVGRGGAPGTSVADVPSRETHAITTRSAALILHDDEPTLGLVRRVLGDAGFEVATAASPWRAVAVDRSDVGFAVLGAAAIDERELEIVSVLRERWPQAFLLVLFPAPLRDRALRALELGADASLPEPFYPGELASIARRVGALHGVEAPPTQPTTPPAQPAPAAPARAATPAPRSPPAGAAPPAAAAAPSSPVSPHAPPPAPAEPTPRGRAGSAVEQLAAGVAHSIRNPLQVLELQLGSVEAEGSLDVPALREQLERIASVVDGLTRFSGHRNLSLRPVDLNQLVARVFVARRLPGAGPDFLVRTVDARAEVLAAAELLRMGLDALRSRAERVTPREGRVEVEIRIRADESRRVVEIAVTDGGPSLSEERRARLFDPYPDTDTIQDGTGLELAGLAGIVRDHGGSVVALAAPGGGTTIVVRLPVRPEADAGGGAAPAARGPR